MGTIPSPCELRVVDQNSVRKLESHAFLTHQLREKTYGNAQATKSYLRNEKLCGSWNINRASKPVAVDSKSADVHMM
jgi:hypothetical protein